MLSVTSILKPIIPYEARRWLRRQQLRFEHAFLPLRKVRNFDRLRRVTPIGRDFGAHRGAPIDRYYVEKFLSAHALDVRGRVLEIQNDDYTRKFGDGRVTQREVLHLVEGNPKATIVADLTRADHVPSDVFDCVICTQTLLLIYDVRAAIQTLYRILKPGGVVLVTIPGVAHQIARDDMDHGGDYWRFTSLSARRLFCEVFPSENVTVQTYGNVLTAISFLHGLAVEELEKHELDYNDPDYELSIGIRAVKT